MDEQQGRAFDFVVSLRDFYGDYHAKKEREAYVTAVLYLGATVAFITQPESRQWTLLRTGIIGVTFLALVLVAFQLYHRWFAARMVAACTTTACRWLAETPIREQYRSGRLKGRIWPKGSCGRSHC